MKNLNLLCAAFAAVLTAGHLAHASALCTLTVKTRIDSRAVTQELQRLERSDRRLQHSLQELGTELFRFRVRENEVSTIRTQADSAEDCYRLALEESQKHDHFTEIQTVEIEALSEVTENRFIKAPMIPVVRWKFDDSLTFDTVGAVSKYTASCRESDETRVRGPHLFREDCSGF